MLNLFRPAQQFAISNEWYQTYKQSFPVLFPQARKLYPAVFAVLLTVVAACMCERESKRL